MENLITIQAKRVKETKGIYAGYNKTEFYKDGILFAIVPAQSTQPRKGIKTYTLNCWKWAIQWLN